MMLLITPEWLSGDGLKMAVFVAAAVALFALARWSGSRSESSPNSPEFTPTDTSELSSPHYLETPTPAPAAEMHPEIQYGDLLICGLNFRTFDALPGPLDPGCFCDEILLELENLGTGHRFIMSHVVATPEGLRQALAEKRWQIMYLPTVYVVARYDLKLIRDTIMRVYMEGEESVEELRPSPDQGADPIFGSSPK